MHSTTTLPHLPAAIARDTLETLIALLPPVADRAARDRFAIAAVAALRPADAAQALLAAQIVGAHFHAMDRFRAAVQPGLPVTKVLRCRSEALTMMRRMQSGLATLLRIQDARGMADVAVHPAEPAREPPAARRPKLHLVH